MCRGLDNASQKETVLRSILSKCIEQGNFAAVETKFEHPTMESDGLLVRIDGAPPKYKLTTMAIGLLYSVYGKGVE
jgi:hypothetical protein